MVISSFWIKLKPYLVVYVKLFSSFWPEIHRPIQKKVTHAPASALWISLCGRISMATVYEYNNLFLLVSKWRKRLRNHIKHAARKLGGPEFVAYGSQKRLAVCHVPARKRNKCWSFPHWWLISRYSHTHSHSASSKNSHISCLFPTRQARRKGIFSGCGWWHADGVERREELNLPVPVCQFVRWVAVLCFSWRRTLSCCLVF